MGQITSRDIRLFTWINGHGFVDAQQVQEWMGVSKQAAYLRLKKLEAMECVISRQLYGHSHALIMLDKKGHALANSSAPRQTDIRIAELQHDLKLIDLLLDMKRKDPDISIIPERELRYYGGWGDLKGHTPDAVFLNKALIEDDKFIAIELETSQKSRQKLRTIIKHYARSRDIYRIHYYVEDPRIGNLIIKEAKKWYLEDFIDIIEFSSRRDYIPWY